MEKGMDDEKLIEIVRNFKWLYDTKHPKFFKINYRDKTWSDVALKMSSDGSITVDDCKKRWKQLKDAHRKQVYYRKNPRCITKWRFAKQMSFMIPILIENKRLTSSKPKQIIDGSGDHDNDNDNDNETENGNEDNYNDDEDLMKGGIASDNEDSFIVPTSPTPILKGNDWFLNHSDEMSKYGADLGTNGEFTENYQNGINLSPSVYPNSTNNGYANQTLQNGPFHENPLDRNLTNFMRLIETSVQNFTIIQQVEVKRKINEVISEAEMQNALAASNSVV